MILNEWKCIMILWFLINTFIGKIRILACLLKPSFNQESIFFCDLSENKNMFFLSNCFLFIITPNKSNKFILPCLNPFTPSCTHMPFLDKISILKKKGYHWKNFLWAPRLWVGRRQKPILVYISKIGGKKLTVECFEDFTAYLHTSSSFCP